MNTLEILILTLETRTCLCGCGYTFRVLPASPCRYAAVTHIPSSNGNEVNSWQTSKKRSKMVNDTYFLGEPLHGNDEDIKSEFGR
jgi:hypothetical protein